MLYMPRVGMSKAEDNQATTSAEYGVAVTAGSPLHTKNTTYTTLIASTAYDSWGIGISFYNTAIASTRTGVLVDIAFGAAASETVIIPNLLAGNITASGLVGSAECSYYFPIFIDGGSRISATAQAFTAGDTVNVLIHLFQYKTPGVWFGTRVTNYGALTASSSGTSMSPGNSSYATPVTLGTTTTPIKYMQLGTDLYTNATGSTARGLIKISIGNDSPILVQDLPYLESTTVESVGYATANFFLSRMMWNIPSGIDLQISAMRNIAAATRGWAIYGVD